MWAALDSLHRNTLISTNTAVAQQCAHSLRNGELFKSQQLSAGDNC